MANLLAKFRIDYSDVIVIPEVAKKATEESRSQFECLIEPFKVYSKPQLNEEDEGVCMCVCFLCVHSICIHTQCVFKVYTHYVYTVSEYIEYLIMQCSIYVTIL